MGLFSFLRRDRSAANERPPRGRRAGDLPSADVVRAQARRRLIGAAVLVVAAVLLLPLVFDSKPRPLPVDIPIEVPKRDLAAALPEPPPPRGEPRQDLPGADAQGRAAASAAVGGAAAPAVAAVPAPAASVPPPVAATSASGSETAKLPPAKSEAPPAEHKGADARKEPVPAKPAQKPEPKPAPKSEPKPEAKPAAKPEPKKPDAKKPEPGKAEVPKPEPNRSAAEAARAQAALEGRSPPVVAPSRFVVQVGAFEQADGAREARQRVAKAGLQAHESTVQTDDGKRIRVRLGPFSSREEAERAAAKLRAAGLSGAVMPQ